MAPVLTERGVFMAAEAAHKVVCMAVRPRLRLAPRAIAAASNSPGRQIYELGRAARVENDDPRAVMA